LALLTDDIVMMSDGGGKTAAALNPIFGPEKVARYFLGVLKKMPPNFTVEIAEVNGQLAVLGFTNGKLYNVLLLDIAGERIRGVHQVLNPDKLLNFPMQTQHDQESSGNGDSAQTSAPTG
jgi:RNA polymerase sigma-70 factor, ECF subfamily